MIVLFILIIALIASYRGMGLPNHEYQWGLGCLAVALGYHRGWFKRPKHAWQWAMALLNALQMSFLFKLLIGSGKKQPFFWLKLPELGKTQSSGSWSDFLPSLAMSWQTTALSSWEVDLTRIQTFLLLVTILGAVVRFQPFVSFTALFLILASIPALSAFDWNWVFPALTAAGVAFYLQATSHLNKCS